MSQYINIQTIPNVDDSTTWSSDGDFYWPDPKNASLWNGTDFVKSEEAVTADLPDHMHWHKVYVENQPTLFEEVV